MLWRLYFPRSCKFKSESLQLLHNIFFDIFSAKAVSHHYRIRFKLTSPFLWCILWRTYTQNFFFWILLVKRNLNCYYTFFNIFGTKRNSIWCQINLITVITIKISFKWGRFRIYLSVLIPLIGIPTNSYYYILLYYRI